MKVALVHDYLIRIGGAERVLFELHKLFPEAPIYALIYDQEKVSEFFSQALVRTSFLQKLPKFLRCRQKYLLPLMPVAAESFDLREFDLVISSSSAFAKSIVTRPGTTHVCYCHAPSRFLWDWSHQYLKDQETGPVRAALARILMHYLRVWDRASSHRVDYFIANSRSTQEKIRKYYRMDSFLVYPPVVLASLQDFKDSAVGSYFLIISQLAPYKRIDLAVEAFNKLKLPLVIIGDGPERNKLENMAENNVVFLGWTSEEKKNCYLKNCAAFIFPGEDDFGIAPVEAMGWGKPVLAFRAGGARETVLEGVSGEFFDEPVPETLADGVRRLRQSMPHYSPFVIRKWAEKFSEYKFRREIMDFVGKIGYNSIVNSKLQIQKSR